MTRNEIIKALKRGKKTDKVVVKVEKISYNVQNICYSEQSDGQSFIIIKVGTTD